MLVMEPGGRSSHCAGSRSFFRAQLGEQNPVRLHANTALQELLRRHAREPLIVLRVKETDVIRVGVENEFLASSIVTSRSADGISRISALVQVVFP